MSRPLLSLSTCWLSHRHQDGAEMLDEMAQLGFEYVELGHGNPISLIPGVLDALEQGVIRVSSTHNFCPLPRGVGVPSPNLYEPSATLKSAQQQWSFHTANTLQFSQTVGASVMVAHLGSQRFFWGDPSRAYRAAVNAKESAANWADEDLKPLREKLLKKAGKKAPRSYDRIAARLESVLPLAQELGVRIAAENRDGMLELPLDGDMLSFYQRFAGNPFFALWHDVGHARVKALKGVLDHEAFLESCAPHLAGFHLHEVNDFGRDHQPLGEGGLVDWDMIKKYIAPHHLLVLEISPKATAEQIRTSKKFVEDKLLS